jgi:hypothetical protein
MALGKHSLAAGFGATAATFCATAIGRYSVGGGTNATDWNGTDPIFEIGIGSGPAARANAMTVLKNGAVGIGTSAPVAGLDILCTSIGSNAIRVNDCATLGSGIYLRQIGTGNAARFDIANTASTSNCLEASSDGIGATINASNSNTAGFILQLNNGATRRMFVETNGNVGIGVDDATQDLDVLNNARFRGVGSGSYSAALNLTSSGILTTATSDRRLKEAVRPLERSLEKVLALRGVRFHWKQDFPKTDRIGFIAQEVESVLPELVFTNPTDGFMGVNYAEMTAMLAEAIKEQQELIDALTASLHEANARLEELRSENDARFAAFDRRHRELEDMVKQLQEKLNDGPGQHAQLPK